MESSDQTGQCWEQWSDKRKRESGARKQKKKKQREDGIIHGRTTYHSQRVESATR